MQPMTLQFRYIEILPTTTTTASAGGTSNSGSKPSTPTNSNLGSNASNNYRVVTVKKTFSSDMVIGEIVSLLMKEFKVPNTSSKEEEYGLLYYLDSKTNFWLEETEK